MANVGTFRKGALGNPKGRNQWDALKALRMAAAKPHGKSGQIKLERIAQKIVSQAIQGNAAQQQLVFNYLAGKPKEIVEVQHGPSELLMQFMRAIGRGDFEGKGEIIDAIPIEDKTDG